MFDPRDLIRDHARSPGGDDPRANRKQEKTREGHRRKHEPRRQRQSFEDRSDRALADVGMYRGVSYRDLSEAHFEGHPYATRRAVDRMIRGGFMREHQARGPKGGSYKVLTLTRAGAARARRLAHQHGLDKDQRAWAGLVKREELQHDAAIYRAARIEHVRLAERGAIVDRVRIDAEMKKDIARAGETARTRGGKEAADAARFQAADELGLPVRDGRVLYPDAQLEYTDAEGRGGRVNIEIATEHYHTNAIAMKAAAGFQMHGSGGKASALIARALGGDGGGDGGGGGRGRGGDKATVEL